MPENVKCADCGLLQIRAAQSHEFVAVERGIRDTGDIPTDLVPRIGQQHRYEREIECLAGVPIRAEFDELPENDRWKDRFTQVTGRLRDCPEFIGWKPGLSPKEHREMSLLAKVEQRSAELRGEDVERAKQWRAEDIAWRQETEQSIERRHRSHFILHALLAALTVAASIVGALIAVAIR